MPGIGVLSAALKNSDLILQNMRIISIISCEATRRKERADMRNLKNIAKLII